MVVIKNTMCFQEEGLKEYADLEIMQMLGRAGRYTNLGLLSCPRAANVLKASIRRYCCCSNHNKARKATKVREDGLGSGAAGEQVSYYQ